MSLILQMDGGNTRLKWRLIDSEMRVLSEGAEVYSDLDPEEFTGRLHFEQIKKIYFASVRICENLHAMLAELKRVYGDESVVEVDHLMFRAAEFAYSEFSRLGIDRCLAIVGARNYCSGACLVIDAGSAITADIVDCRGMHVGGYIFPGVLMLKGALLGGTSKISVEEEVCLSLEPGVTTEECVSHALDVMVRSSLGFVVEKAKEFDAGRVVVAGGDASYVASLLEGCVDVCPDILFKGMSIAVGLEG